MSENLPNPSAQSTSLSAVASSPAAPDSMWLPRLSLLHLMLWMTLSALLFWQGRLTLANQQMPAATADSVQIDIGFFQTISTGLHSLVGGFVLTGLITLARRAVRCGPLAPDAPT